MSRTVYVGLSGGVDSAVSAALLQQQGYKVHGVFIKIWQPEFIECTWREDRLDAMRVAAHLRIPFHEIDLSDEYKDEIVADMIAAYRLGTTPNPDVLCNERIKFGHFQSWAHDHGANFVATGHYARTRVDAHGVHLLRGVDTSKDQSYFLHRLSPERLTRILFPVGELPKSEVRAFAAHARLPVAHKPDSQGLCFVGAITLKDFLARYITLERGDVVDEHGTRVGEHDGAALFTIGQRHGFTLHSPSKTPHYVVAINIDTNTIVVGETLALAKRAEIEITNTTWVQKPSVRERLLVQTRYRETPVSAYVQENHIAFDEPHLVSRGQSAVVYRDEECLGGGTITDS